MRIILDPQRDDPQNISCECQRNLKYDQLCVSIIESNQSALSFQTEQSHSGFIPSWLNVNHLSWRGSAGVKPKSHSSHLSATITPQVPPSAPKVSWIRQAFSQARKSSFWISRALAFMKSASSSVSPAPLSSKVRPESFMTLPKEAAAKQRQIAIKMTLSIIKQDMTIKSNSDSQ